jgi:hypothetical protein
MKLSNEKLKDLQSSWIAPSGDIYTVPPEMHDYNLPGTFTDAHEAEKVYMKISASWGWDAKISYLYTPLNGLSVEQAQLIRDIVETVGDQFIMKIYSNKYFYEEILDLC